MDDKDRAELARLRRVNAEWGQVMDTLITGLKDRNIPVVLGRMYTAAALAEIDRLRALLKHYMRNVRQHSGGTDFLYPRHITRDETRDDWTDEEYSTLLALQHELDGEPRPGKPWTGPLLGPGSPDGGK